jgi:peptide subunit release factor 1 (eRF1)
MITREAIRELAEFESPEGCALTFYYQPDTPQNQSHREEAILVKDLVREALKEAEKSGKNEFARKDLQRILEVAERLHGNGRKGKAIFADASKGLWREFDVPARLPGTTLIVNRRFHLKPLSIVTDVNPRICVCAMDRSKARLFNYQNGEISEVIDFFNELPRRGRSDGWGGFDAGHAERRVTNDAAQHFKLVADTLLEMHERGGFDNLLIGCREDVWSEIEPQLHVYLKEKLLGRFRTDPVQISESNIREEVDRLLQQSKTKRRDELVREVIGEAHRNARGAIGLRRVLRSLETGEVQTLLIGERFKASGSECRNCGHIEMRQASDCTVCGMPTGEVEDLADALIGKALRSGVEVLYIKEDEAFERAGHIGALLRFRADQNTAMRLAS